MADPAEVLVGSLWEVIEDRTLVFKSANSGKSLHSLDAGARVIVSGPAEDVDGYWMVPIQPQGAVELDCIIPIGTSSGQGKRLPAWYSGKPHISGRPLRVLALHGNIQNPKLFRIALARLSKVGQKRIELIYIAGQKAAGPQHPGYESMQGKYPSEKLCVYTEPEEIFPKEGMVRYCDLEGCTAYLQEEMKAQAPIDGVLGFSQGGAVASVLAAQAVMGTGHPLAFAVHICTPGPGWREQHPKLFSEPLRIPSLHIRGAQDIITEDRFEKMIIIDNNR